MVYMYTVHAKVCPRASKNHREGEEGEEQEEEEESNKQKEKEKIHTSSSRLQLIR